MWRGIVRQERQQAPPTLVLQSEGNLAGRGHAQPSRMRVSAAGLRAQVGYSGSMDVGQPRLRRRQKAVRQSSRTRRLVDNQDVVRLGGQSVALSSDGAAGESEPGKRRRARRPELQRLRGDARRSTATCLARPGLLRSGQDWSCKSIAQTEMRTVNAVLAYYFFVAGLARAYAMDPFHIDAAALDLRGRDAPTYGLRRCPR